jgi:surfactin synthase thioesterase subunit
MSSNGSLPWLARLRESPAAGGRIICFPHAGSGASFYRPWAQLMPARVALDAVQLPGRETRLREPLQSDIHSIADRVAESIAPSIRMPVVLFGHSMGALLAYEVARRFEVSAIPVAALIVSGRRAPQMPRRERDLRHCNEETLLSELSALYGAIPDVLAADPELRAIYVPILRADLTAVETYAMRDAAALKSPLWAFGGRSDPLGTPAEIDAWRARTIGHFESRFFEGGHFFIQSARQRVLRTIFEAMSAAGVDVSPDVLAAPPFSAPIAPSPISR